jgi:hypothetical protein
MVGMGVLDNGAPWWAENWSILDGTVRFDGAEGSGSLFRVFAGFTTTSPVTMDGTLSY